jgi:hypothetical protein
LVVCKIASVLLCGEQQTGAQQFRPVLAAMHIHRPRDGGFDLAAVFHQLVIHPRRRGQLVFVLAFLEIAGFGGNPARHGDHRLDGCLAQHLVGFVHVFGEDVGELALSAHGDQLHRLHAKLLVVAAAALAQRRVKRLDLFEHLDLQRLLERIEHRDHAAEPMHGGAPHQRVEHDGFFMLSAAAKRFEQQFVSRLVFRVDQSLNQAIEDHLYIIGPERGAA